MVQFTITAKDVGSLVWHEDYHHPFTIVKLDESERGHTGHVWVTIEQVNGPTFEVDQYGRIDPKGVRPPAVVASRKVFRSYGHPAHLIGRAVLVRTEAGYVLVGVVTDIQDNGAVWVFTLHGVYIETHVECIFPVSEDQAQSLVCNVVPLGPDEWRDAWRKAAQQWSAPEDSAPVTDPPTGSPWTFSYVNFT